MGSRRSGTPRHLYEAVPKLQVAGVGLQLAGADLQKLAGHLPGSPDGGVAHAEDGAAGAGGLVEGSHVGIGKGNGDPFPGQSQHLAHHLRQAGLDPLADLHAPGQQSGGAVCIEPDAGGGMGRRHRGLDHHRHALAPDQRCGRRGRLLRPAAPLDRLGGGPETVLQSHRLQGIAGDEDVAVVHQVPEPHLHRVQPETARHVVHLRLVGPAHLGHTETPVGSGGRGVGVDAPGREALVRNAVGSAGNLAAVARGGRPGQGVGAGVVDRLHLPRQDRSVALHAGLDPHHRRVAMAGEEHFLAGELPLHRPARLAGQRRGQGFQPQVHLATVAAPDVGHHHPHHGLRQLEQLGELHPDG